MEVEPSQEVTGGLTGSTDFGLDKMAVIADKVEMHARKEGRISYRELLVYIKQCGMLTTEQLRDEYIK